MGRVGSMSGQVEPNLVASNVDLIEAGRIGPNSVRIWPLRGQSKRPSCRAALKSGRTRTWFGQSGTKSVETVEPAGSKIPTPEGKQRATFPCSLCPFIGESACRSEILELGPLWKVARTWTLKIQVVPRSGLLARIWEKIGPIGMARRGQARDDTLGPRRLCNCDFRGISVISPKLRFSTKPEFRRTRTLPDSGLAPLRLASLCLLCDKFSSLSQTR